jgi:hypothetical protein
MVGSCRELQRLKHWQNGEKMDAEQIQQLRDILCSSYQKNVNDNMRDIWREINSMKKNDNDGDGRGYFAGRCIYRGSGSGLDSEGITHENVIFSSRNTVCKLHDDRQII